MWFGIMHRRNIKQRCAKKKESVYYSFLAREVSKFTERVQRKETGCNTTWRSEQSTTCVRSRKMRIKQMHNNIFCFVLSLFPLRFRQYCFLSLRHFLFSFAFFLLSFLISFPISFTSSIIVSFLMIHFFTKSLFHFLSLFSSFLFFSFLFLFLSHSLHLFFTAFSDFPIHFTLFILLLSLSSSLSLHLFYTYV